MTTGIEFFTGMQGVRRKIFSLMTIRLDLQEVIRKASDHAHNATAWIRQKCGVAFLEILTLGENPIATKLEVPGE